MATFKDKCVQYFGTSNFYELLGISKQATEKEIKKAYHKLSLLVHPDRVDDNHKKVATEKFKVLGRIHSVLQDEAKRKIYDDCGEFDEEGDTTFNWKDYWLSMFKKIELSDIQKYEKEYIGSETEKRDIKKAYESSKGNMDVLLDMVCFSNCDSEDRFRSIVRKMIDDGEVPEYDGFFNENKAKAARRRRKWEREEKELEGLNVTALEQEMQANLEKRAEAFGSLLSNLEHKYGPKKTRKSISNGPSNKKPRKK